MVTFLSVFVAVFRAIFMGKQALVLENLALRQQLGVYLRKGKRPPLLKPLDRVFWVFLSRIWRGWKSTLVIVKPDTVIGWHRQGFKLFWRWRSRTNKVGRPRISRKHIEFIKRISRENPAWGEDYRLVAYARFVVGFALLFRNRGNNRDDPSSLRCPVIVVRF